jgi:hypothetical protein
MDDWQKLSLYTESRLEDLRQQAANARLAGDPRPPFGRLILISAVLLIGLAIWWIL